MAAAKIASASMIAAAVVAVQQLGECERDQRS
jgi:hypothetical protein